MSSVVYPHAARRATFAALAAFLIPVTAPAHTLEEAVRLAVTSNPAARAADADVRASALELLQLEGDYLPTVNLTARAEGTIHDEAFGTGPGEDRASGIRGDVTLSASYVLFDGYRRSNSVYRNAARLDGAILGRLDASETLSLSAVQAYIDVARHEDLLAVSGANIARHEEIRAQVDSLVDGGRLPASAALEIEQRLLAAQLARIEVEQALNDANARFETLVGTAPRGGYSVPVLRDLPPSREAMVALAVSNSYRIQFARTAVSERDYERALRSGETLPTVSLDAGVRRDWDDFDADGDRTSGFVGLNLEWELYAGGRAARDAALAARTREAEARQAEIVREVQEIASRAWNAHEAAVSQVVLLDVQERGARNVVRQYDEEFQAGTRNLIELLDAERSLFNVRFEAISARAAMAFSGYRILAAQSRLAAQFGIAPSETPLVASFESRARAAERPNAIFNTEIRALE
jgi:adhesin transport system outer membrane protein